MPHGGESIPATLCPDFLQTLSMTVVLEVSPLSTLIHGICTGSKSYVIIIVRCLLTVTDPLPISTWAGDTGATGLVRVELATTAARTRSSDLIVLLDDLTPQRAAGGWHARAAGTTARCCSCRSKRMLSTAVQVAAQLAPNYTGRPSRPRRRHARAGRPVVARTRSAQDANVAYCTTGRTPLQLQLQLQFITRTWYNR
eukprot:COSAG02_NODE_7087_length_3191_cov_6.196657_3_plen_198_part_00